MILLLDIVVTFEFEYSSLYSLSDVVPRVLHMPCVEKRIHKFVWCVRFVSVDDVSFAFPLQHVQYQIVSVDRNR